LKPTSRRTNFTTRGDTRLVSCWNSRPRAKRLNRSCKTCAKPFQIRASYLNTNASGNFCSRPCYHAHLRTIRGPEHRDWRGGNHRFRGAGWTESRRICIQRQKFCGLCGKTKNLHAHHLVPYRLTRDNSQKNLVALCPRCHKHVENHTWNCEAIGASPAMTAFVIKNIIDARRQVLKFQFLEVLRAQQKRC